MASNGVFPIQTIKAMVQSGQIKSITPVEAGQFQPASLDLRLGTKAFRIRASFLAGKGKTVADGLKDVFMHEISLENEAVLEKGCVYLVPLQESLDIPNTVSAFANAKSSTGRLDLFTRLIADGGVEFDRVEAGYKGPLYAEISPLSFSVIVKSGMRLNQIRFRNGQALLTDNELKALHEKVQLVSEEAHIDEGLAFSVDLSGDENKPVGYKARAHTGLINLDHINHYAVDDFWEPVFTRNQKIILDPGSFYILKSSEAVHIPPDYAAEMAPYVAVVGEFRVHYAGFFDPGFGHSAAGGAGSRGVLEVRCQETPFVMQHRQIVGRLIYERMTERPDIIYGNEMGSNYQGQDLKLSKHFKAA